MSAPPVLLKRNHWCEPSAHELRYHARLDDGVFVETWGCVNCDTLLRRESAPSPPTTTEPTEDNDG